MWTILFVVYVGASQGGVATQTLGTYNNVSICTAVAAKLQQSFERQHPTALAQCVQIKDKP